MTRPAQPPDQPMAQAGTGSYASERLRELDRIDLHLVRVLHQVLSERSVTRAALKLGMHQPGVSAALRRLRDITGDPLLVRQGSQMVPTDVGEAMIEPAARLLHMAEQLFRSDRHFDPQHSEHCFRIAASDYLDPLFLPRLVTLVRQRAPLTHVDIHALSHASDYRDQLASGALDLVIGNWMQPPEHLHMTRLFSDEVVCLVSKEHPAVRRGWSREDWLQAEHIAPTPTYPGARGVIDECLDAQGLQRNIVVRSAWFSLIPHMVAGSLLVLTTGRQYCEYMASRLPLAILPCPVPMPDMLYYQLWHGRSQSSPAARWLRDCVRDTVTQLQQRRQIESQPPTHHTKNPEETQA